MNLYRDKIYGWILSIILIILISGCGSGVHDPWEIWCESGNCWDLSGINGYITVNNLPIVDRLSPNSSGGIRLKTTVGHTYTIITRVKKGSCSTYVSPHEVIDTRKTDLKGYGSSKITFRAQESIYYILIATSGRACEFSLRVISYDENRESLPGTYDIEVNGGSMSFSLLPDGIVRLKFHGIIGRDYTVRVDVLKGRTDTFLSVIPSVDRDVYELADFYSDRGISFRATETTTYYIAVQDRGNVTGSDVVVEVTSP